MLNLYFILAVIFALVAYVAIEKNENDGAPLVFSQYFAVAFCGLLWPIVAILLIIDFWPTNDNEEDDGEEENIE